MSVFAFQTLGLWKDAHNEDDVDEMDAEVLDDRPDLKVSAERRTSKESGKRRGSKESSNRRGSRESAASDDEVTASRLPYGTVTIRISLQGKIVPAEILHASFGDGMWYGLRTCGSGLQYRCVSEIGEPVEPVDVCGGRRKSAALQG